MTIDSNPDFWEWLIRKQREESIRKDSGFEPIPLYIELEIPGDNPNRLDQLSDQDESDKQPGLSEIIDYSIDDDSIIRY